MNTNLFNKEMRGNLTALVIWMIVITLLISVTMSVYPAFIANYSKVTGMLDLIPKGVLQFKGISDFNDLLSVEGFYAVNNVIYMMLLGSIYAIVLSSNILLKEEYNKTAEYLLTKPLTRSEVFLSKAAVLYLNVILLNLVTALAGLICIGLFKNGAVNTRVVLILSFYTLMLNMMFASTGLFLSAMVKRPRPVTTLSIAIVLILYFVYTLSKITESVAKIGYLSPFKFVNLNITNPAYKLEIINIAYFTGMFLLLFFLSYRLYLRRDILS